MNGLDIELGLTTPDEQEALVKQTAMSLANQSFVLIDHSKFNKVYFARVPLLESTTIITSKKALNQECLKEYQQKYHFIGGPLGFIQSLSFLQLTMSFLRMILKL
ncbi:hypothetical protein JVV08_18535, partial [Vibrio cholerae O1]|nr:hypothetical protein [Vibrio cholerae O1]